MSWGVEASANSQFRSVPRPAFVLASHDSIFVAMPDAGSSDSAGHQESPVRRRMVHSAVVLLVR